MSALVEIVRRAVHNYGRPILLRRIGPPKVEVTILARVHSYAPQDLVGGLQQGDRKLVIAPLDLAAAGYPGMPKPGDQVVIDQRTAVVQGCEPRHDGLDLARYDVWIRGGV